MVIRIRYRDQRGIVLLMALVALLLISAVGAALIYMATAESALVANQRSITRVYEAAVGGLEEARARLNSDDPSYIGTPPTGPGNVFYILNPNPAGEFTIADVTTNATSPYYDWEYDREWCPTTNPTCGALAAATVQTVNSDMITQFAAPPMPAIPYKWVRITVLTEEAAKRDIDGVGGLNNAIPVFFSSDRQNLTGTGDRVYRLTSLALLPDPSGGPPRARRIAQVDVVAIPASGGWNFAIASGNAMTGLPDNAIIEGSLFSNTEIVLGANTTVIGGDVEAGSEITGGVLNLDPGSDYQARANSGVSVTSVTGGGSPNQVSGAGTVEVMNTPATSPAAPPDNIPNPAWTEMAPKVTDTVATDTTCDPPLGSTDPLTGGCIWNIDGRVVEFTHTDRNRFGPNDRFVGAGTIIFSGGQSVNFENPIGTAAAPAQINIIARPADDNTLGFDTFTFENDVYVNGLIYSHGEVYHSCASGTHDFIVRGTIITYAYGATDPTIPNGDFEDNGSCGGLFDVRLDPSQFTANPPPGFETILSAGPPTPAGVRLLNWREIPRP